MKSTSPPTRSRTKKLLDLLPLVILTLQAMLLIWMVLTTDSGLHWKNAVAIIFIPLNFLAFCLSHKLGVVTLGFTLLLGLVGLISYDHEITTELLTIGKTEGSRFPIFYGQPIFLLWFIVHIILSGKYYFGILTKSYWKAIVPNSDDSLNS